MLVPFAVTIGCELPSNGMAQCFLPFARKLNIVVYPETETDAVVSAGTIKMTQRYLMRY
jgi:hypothetical protein